MLKRRDHCSPKAGYIDRENEVIMGLNRTRRSRAIFPTADLDGRGSIKAAGFEPIRSCWLSRNTENHNDGVFLFMRPGS